MAPHKQGGQYLKDVVYGASDGIVTTFAVVAGVVGAALDPFIVLILGIANLLADAFSMGAGNFLGSKSESELYMAERKREEYEMQAKPEEERREIREILAKHGYQGEKLDTMTNDIMGNKEFAVEFMMTEELGMLKPESGKEFKTALATFIAFVVAGSVPLVPYVLSQMLGQNAGTNQFFYAVLFTGMALFLVGALRVRFIEKHVIIAGLEMLATGGIAAAIAYGVGFFLRQLVGGII